MTVTMTMTKNKIQNQSFRDLFYLDQPGDSFFFLNRHQQLQHDTGRQSVMSECNTNNPSSSPGLSTNATLAPSSGGYGGRRAYDPVRVLDRNFGVGGPHHIQSRHRSGSYAGGQQQHAENHNYQV